MEISRTAHDWRDVIYVFSDEEELDIINETITSSVITKLEPRKNSTEVEQCLTSKPLICQNCTQCCEDLQTYETHLFSNRTCFISLTEHLWFKKLFQQQLCGMCGEIHENQLLLKRHCYDNEMCRQGYINLYTGENQLMGKLMQTSNSKSDSTIVESSNFSLPSQCINNYVPSINTTKALILKEEKEKCHTFLSTKKNIYFQGQNTEAPSVKEVKATSQTQIDNHTTTSYILTKQNILSNSLEIKSPLSRLPQNILANQRYDHKLKSPRNKKKQDVAAGRRCSRLKESSQTITCLHCRNVFPSEDRKITHFILSLECQMFLNERFINKKFCNKIPICDDYNLNKNMCPFCLFTSDNGNVFDHVLHVTKCRKELEEGILRYDRQNSSLPTVETVPVQTQPFLCDRGSRSFSSVKYLKAHKNKIHHRSSDHNQLKRAQNITSGDLYCFFCKKFLKSETQIVDHQCKPTRLLSRSYYRKAVWRGDYECKLCDDQFFCRKNVLEKHMYKHDKRESPLFKFVKHSLKENDTSHPDTLTNELYQRSDKDFTCEKCHTSFYRPEELLCHVFVLKPSCLMYYENPNNASPANLPFCFKCKRNLRNHGLRHDCIGLVSQIYKCALCHQLFSNIGNLRNHENKKHKENALSEYLQDKQVSSDTEAHDDETPVYRCSVCPSTFLNSNQFVVHISQVHSLSSRD